MTGRRFNGCQSTLVAALLTLLPSAARPAPATLLGTVTGGDGAPLPARVAVLTQDWKKSQIAFTDREGRYRLEFQSGKCLVIATHGPEYGIAERTAELRPGSNRLEVALDRVLDMSRLGWHCGDVHIHSNCSDGAQPPADIAWAAQCEGLDWAILTDSNTAAGLEEWLAQAGPAFVPLAGQEVATSRGHILGIGAAEPISPDASHGANDMYRICTQIRAQEALAVVAHPNAPGMSYRDWDLRSYDGIEILNGALPPPFGAPDALQGRRKWYELLGRGEQPLPFGGSASRDITSAPLRRILENPSDAARRHAGIALLLRALPADAARLLALRAGYIGSVRTYVQCPELTAEAILTGLRSGTTFVTTGPLLLATVDGRLPGETVNVHGKHAVTIRLEAASNHALERIDIVADGEVVRSIAGAHLMRLERTVDLPVAGWQWLVIECYGESPDMAVTNAWDLQR